MSTTKILWIIASVLGLLLLAISLFIPGNVILEHAPACYSIKQYGKECFMCGSTRSFILLAGGDSKGAWRLNRFAVLLFIAITVNSAAFLIYMINRKITVNK